MPVIKHNDIQVEPVAVDGAKAVNKANVVGAPEGWQSHTLRVFRIEPGGHTPRHNHEWEHVNYVIDGQGRLRIGEKVHKISAGDFAFVPPNTEHQFENPYGEPFEFICIVPSDAKY